MKNKRYYIITWAVGRIQLWNGVSWSYEYPDAILFTSLRDANKIAEKVGRRELQVVSVMRDDEEGNPVEVSKH